MATPVYHAVPQQKAVAAPAPDPGMALPVHYAQQPTQQEAKTVASGYSVAPAPAPGVAYYSPQKGAVQLYQGQCRSPKCEYTPNDFLVLSVLTVMLCGLFFPLSLATSIPALLFSKKSRQSNKLGQTKVARQQGMIAAYLNIFAIIFSLVLAMLGTGLTLGLYLPMYYGEKCRDYIREESYYSYGKIHHPYSEHCYYK